MYQIHIRQGDEIIKHTASNSEVEQIKKAQVSGQSGFWLQGEYYSIGSVRAITKDIETKMEPVTNFLKLPDENTESQRQRIRRRLNEMRDRLNRKGIVKK